MISCANLVVRHRFGDGPVDCAQRAWRCSPAGRWLEAGTRTAQISLHGWMYGRGVAVSKSDFATYAFALDALNVRAFRSKVRFELHSPTMKKSAARSGRVGCCAKASSPISPSARASPTASLPLTTAACIWRWRRGALGRCRQAVHRHRCARGGQRHDGCDLRLSTSSPGAGLEDARHRIAASDGRPDQRRHQHQCRTGSHHVPARSPNDSRRGHGCGRSGAQGVDQRNGVALSGGLR